MYFRSLKTNVMQRLLFTALACLISFSTHCQNNYSVSFDGDNDNIIIEDDASLNPNNITIMTHVKVTSGANYEWQGLIEKRPNYGVGGYGLEINSSGSYYNFALGTGNSYASVSTTVSINEWQHVSATYDGELIRLYIEGQEVASSELSMPNGIIISQEPLSLGSRMMDNYFHGNLDNVIIWDYALTEEEIQLYIECDPTGDELGLIGYWNFEEGPFASAVDLSDNGNDGVVNGATWINETNDTQCLGSLCEQIDVTFLSVNTDFTPNTIEFEIDVQYDDGDGFGYGGFVLANEVGDIVAQETLETAGNVYWIGPGINNESRVLIANEELSFPFSGNLYLIEGFFAGNGNAECVYEFKPGCMSNNAINYDSYATIDDGSCILCNNQIIDSISTNHACVGDPVTIYGSDLCTPMNVHLQGWTIPDDLILTSTQDSVSFIVPSVSFIPYIIQLRFTDDLGEDYYTNTLPFTITNPEIGYDCSGDCIDDLDEDGICDSCEEYDYIIVDCACAVFDPSTFTVFFTDVDETNCIIIEDCYCECINDTDGDGICDENETPGCTDPLACNFNANATDIDNMSCVFIGEPCDDGNPNTLDDEIQVDCECAGTPHTIVDELEALLVLIYPNPASNSLTVDLGDLTGVNTTIKLYDSSSKLVFEKQSSSTLLIDVSIYAKGLYTLELSNSDKVLRSQVVIE